VPTELKIADKWTGPQLFERLEGQLAGDYLRDLGSSRGVYLLVYRGLQKHWQLPSGELVVFAELVAALQSHWVTVSTAHPGVEEIHVIGIDLTKRAKAPIPKKKPEKGAPANEAAAKTTVDKAKIGKKAPAKKSMKASVKATSKVVAGKK
jgi:hypothetical protein